MNTITFVGLDVHQETITVAMSKEAGEVVDIGTIKNDRQAIVRMVKKLGEPKSLLFAYEAGPCGYVLYRQLIKMGANCIVAAPSLIPRAPGERVKTDRRDARKLVTLLRSGQLQPVWVPDEEHEVFRQLVRARENVMEDVKRKKNQISKYLLVTGTKAPAKAWSKDYRAWLLTVKFKFETQRILLNEYLNALSEAEQRLARIEKEISDFSKKSALSELIEALQAMRGVSLITAATVVAEVGDLTRFVSPRQLMSYAGLVPSEHSSGNSVYRGKITKSGNAHLRRIVVEAAWHYRHVPRVHVALRKRQENVSTEVCEIAWKAQHRLNRKYRKLSARGRSNNIAAVAVAREMLGFMWAIAKQVQIESKPEMFAA